MVFALLFNFALAAPLHVMIDPGHGGKDNGASYGSAREADIALSVSQRLKQFLDHDSGFKTSLTRHTDIEVTLPDRVKKAELANADLLLSIHANAATDQRARGMEVYFQNQLPPNEEIMFLAATENQLLQNPEQLDLEPQKASDVQAIVEDVSRQFRIYQSEKLSRALLHAWDPSKEMPSNTIRQAPFYLVSKSKVPSVLVELGFLSNPKEARKLIDDNYQKEIAQKIYRGLVKYRNFTNYNSTPSM